METACPAPVPCLPDLPPHRVPVLLDVPALPKEAPELLRRLLQPGSASRPLQTHVPLLP